MTSITQRFFDPPEAPLFGGVFERMIKSAKRAIYAILNEADVNEMQITFKRKVASVMKDIAT